MKKVVFSICILLICGFLNGQPSADPITWEKVKLIVSENGRYLQYENGEPFFWLGDTGWLLFQRLK